MLWKIKLRGDRFERHGPRADLMANCIVDRYGLVDGETFELRADDSVRIYRVVRGQADREPTARELNDFVDALRAVLRLRPLYKQPRHGWEPYSPPCSRRVREQRFVSSGSYVGG